MESDVDLTDKKSMQCWLARLIDVPKSLIAGETLEEYRWDIAHYFYQIGATWTAAGVIVGCLIPSTFKVNDQYNGIYQAVHRLYEKFPELKKEEFISLFKEHYDSLNPEVKHGS